MTNKWALGIYGFRFPLLLTSCHMAFSFLVLAPFMTQEPFRSKHRDTVRKQWRGLLMMGLFMAANISLNNLSLTLISLSLNQVIRCAHALPWIADLRVRQLRAFWVAIAVHAEAGAGTRRSSLPVVTAVLAIYIDNRYPTRNEFISLTVLCAGVMLAVWEGTVAGSPSGILLCIAATLSNGAMMVTGAPCCSSCQSQAHVLMRIAPDG